MRKVSYAEDEEFSDHAFNGKQDYDDQVLIVRKGFKFSKDIKTSGLT